MGKSDRKLESTEVSILKRNYGETSEMQTFHYHTLSLD